MTTATSPRPRLAAGIAAAVVGALIGASVWAVIASSTDYKIGFAAVGVGALTGLLAGKVGGGAKQLPVIAAVVGLLGCVLGDVLIDAHAFSSAIKEAEGIDVSSWRVLKEMVKDPTGFGWDLYTEGFKALDALFYALAASAGFRLATAQGLLHHQAATPAAAVPSYPPPAVEETQEPSS